MKHRLEYDLKVIGKNLRRMREEKNLTVEQVRSYLRLGSIQAIYKYEEGKGYPQADTLLALMELYEADVNDIVGNHAEKTVFDHSEIEVVSYFDIRERKIEYLGKYLRKIS